LVIKPTVEAVMLRAFFTVPFILFLTFANGGGLAQPIGDGAIGGACATDAPACSQGICDQSLGMCVSCGMPGEAACKDESGLLSCYMSDQGYAPVAGSNARNAICGTDSASDCGQVGALACMRDGAAYCYYGTPVGMAGSGSYCAACGDFGQACCANTDYQCDYGSCQGGTCLPDSNATEDLISAAIDECRFKEAQSLIHSLPAGTNNRSAGQAELDAAMARENRVNTLFQASQGIARDARLSYLAGDYGNAALAYRDAMARLQRAKELTQCVTSLIVLDEGIEINKRDIDQSQGGVSFAVATDALDLCLFDLAEESLVSIPSPNPQRDALLQRVSEMRATEAQVLISYQAAQALNTTGKAQLERGAFADALASFNAAHGAFMQTRQLTNCPDTQNQIDEALAIVGRNILRADEGPTEVGPAPTAPHICLDSSIPATHTVASYQRYLGGGQGFIMKEQFICDFRGDFTTLSKSELVSYDCDRDGDQYINCREIGRYPVTSLEVLQNGVVYNYENRNNEFWIVVDDIE